MKEQHRESGFILAVVLWTLAAMTIIAGTIIAQINATIDQTYRMRLVSERERNMLATEQTLLFLLSGLPRTAAGADLTPNDNEMELDPLSGFEDQVDISPSLRFDSTPYDGIGDVTFALQDTLSTFSLVSEFAEEWRPMTHTLGLSAEAGARLMSQVTDYQDLDDFRSINGAEDTDYRSLSLPAPANRYMVSPHELNNLPIADELGPSLQDLITNSHTLRGGSVQLNTATRLWLQAALGWSEQQASRFVSARQRYNLTGPDTVQNLTGMIVPFSESTQYFPLGPVRIMLGADGRQARWINVTFTSSGEEPWVIEYDHRVDLPFTKLQESTHGPDGISRSDGEARPATSWPNYRAYFPSELSLDG